MIVHNDIGSDEDLAREILIVARGIAPCISIFEEDSEEGRDAVAVLRRVYKTLAARGSQMVKSQRVGSASVEYADIESAFSGQPARALRSLCSASAERGAHSQADFPADRPISRVWPERRA